MKDRKFLEDNGVNVEKSLELFGDMETYNLTLRDFLSAIEEKVKKIKEYKEATDMPNYAILVHSLKSDAKYFGFENLAELAYDHELKSKANNMYYVFDHFNELMKETTKVINIVKEYFGDKTIPVEDIEELKFDPTKDKTILVVDDSNVIRIFIEKVFKGAYAVISAGDGKEAIDIIENRKDNNIVAMLLDLNMPNCSGIEVLEFLKDNQLFNTIPVSIITGEDSNETIEEVAKYPIVEVLTKPFNERDIKRVVEKTKAFNKMM